jgi:hypothetical protein
MRLEGIYSLPYSAYQRNGKELTLIQKNLPNEMYIGLVNIPIKSDTYFLTNKGNVYSKIKEKCIFTNVDKMDFFGESIILLGNSKIKFISLESGRLLIVNKSVKFSSFKMKTQNGVSEFEILQNEVVKDFSIFGGRKDLNILVLTSTGLVYGK